MIFVILASILLADLWVHEFWPTLTYLTTSAARSTLFHRFLMYLRSRQSRRHTRFSASYVINLRFEYT